MMAHDTADHNDVGRASWPQCASHVAPKEPYVVSGDAVWE